MDGYNLPKKEKIADLLQDNDMIEIKIREAAKRKPENHLDGLIA
eukprot:CAMPEP_0114580092 /NCGR_PEP_ID=MMETSP0125-20121206/4432_1 /TAXON_ID=485358 ORGANISM="Aristerostoma sp., Strain ATCC 50986" /NCGR_SAMPLE_ID=MMETSP0125 /ASSEMBLY_ACC=CAM_ASM_000245 /LENGTH=43 /DNA_ID= /DNA_START= /DNA_END= /DNA_ORIENTATION=